MLVLTLRTDKPVAEIGLFDGTEELEYITWQAHRELSDTIHKKIAEILKQCRKDFSDLSGLVVFKGPGSFTGLRIGLTVANALAYALSIPIISTGGEDWLEAGLAELKNGQDDKIAVPEYGAPARTTQQKK